MGGAAGRRHNAHFLRRVEREGHNTIVAKVDMRHLLWRAPARPPARAHTVGQYSHARLYPPTHSHLGILPSLSCLHTHTHIRTRRGGARTSRSLLPFWAASIVMRFGTPLLALPPPPPTTNCESAITTAAVGG